MTDDLKPALSPEEWNLAGFINGPIVANWQSPSSLGEWLVVEADDERVPPAARHALAAACLYQQPFGFTQEDVALLNREANLTDMAAAWCPEGWSVDNPIDQLSITQKRAEAAQLRSLASRISTLLPPSSETE